MCIVCQDENDSAVFKAPVTSGTSKLPSVSQLDKENQTRATKWTKKTVSAAPINVPLEQLAKRTNTAAATGMYIYFKIV